MFKISERIGDVCLEFQEMNVSSDSEAYALLDSAIAAYYVAERLGEQATEMTIAKLAVQMAKEALKLAREGL
jgi:hypothetical protein